MRNISITDKIRGENLEYCRKHLLERRYMSGIERDQARIRATAEIFTPDAIVEDMVEDIGLEIICDTSKRIIDPACGDGQFLAYILWCRILSGASLKESLETLKGIDIMLDNVNLCKQRLACGSTSKEITEILKNNIIENDALRELEEFRDDFDLFSQRE